MGTLQTVLTYVIFCVRLMPYGSTFIMGVLQRLMKVITMIL